MRLWSVHPRYLDAKGLVACWREALLAQAVLLGRTTGYRNHSQLVRFKEARDPVAAIGVFLSGILAEAKVRGYAFDGAKIARLGGRTRLTVTRGQLAYEWVHLQSKLVTRDPGRCEALPSRAQAHPLFRVVAGDVAAWEKC